MNDRRYSSDCGGESVILALLPVLQALDLLLERAVQVAQSAWGSDTASERFRGLYIGPTEIERLLQGIPGTSSLPVADCLMEQIESSHLNSALNGFSLSSFDLAIVLIALAPEIDLRYERLYAYLQDDVTRKHPTVDLVLNLLCPSPEEKLRRRAHFSTDSPLLRHKLIRLAPDPNLSQPSLLAFYIKLDEQIVRVLLGQQGLDDRLAGFCRLLRGGESFAAVPLDLAITTALPKLLEALTKDDVAPVVHFRGPSKTQMRHAATAASRANGSGLLAADCSGFTDGGMSVEEAIALVLRDAKLQGAIPYLEGTEGLSQASVLQALAKTIEPVIVASTKAEDSFVPVQRSAITVDFPPLGPAQRRECWESYLIDRGIQIGASTLEALSNRFRLTPEQICRAVDEACGRARWRSVAQSSNPSAEYRGELLPDDIYAAARAQSGHDLATLAQKIEPKYNWNDIILPEDKLIQLREICSRVIHGPRVLGEWGFDRKLSHGKGTNALFAGPSGTGKTMAAEIIANELKLELYKIDLAGVVSKYIGETEKNLDRIFGVAEDANVILLFDEADALFGKRSEVRDSHDRYANLEISYLLQKMEEYEGISILATNLRHNMDESFIRRLAFTVLFPFPDEDDRRRIWRSIWPDEIPLDADLDLDHIARHFKLSGGNIKNVALSAAFLAASDCGVVTMDHLFHGVRREFEKMGRTLMESELYGPYRNQKSQGTLGALCNH
jgi:AAA+ superfamily predicted ATPase